MASATGPVMKPKGAVDHVPKDYGTVTPYLAVHGADRLIDFLKGAFGAVERGRIANADGTLGHAEVTIGGSVVQMFDAPADWLPTPGFITLYVEDCDTTYAHALAAGGARVTAPADMAWGDRVSRVRDPLGNIWWIQSRMEDVSPPELERRMADPVFQAAMQTAQTTLLKAMRGRA